MRKALNATAAALAALTACEGPEGETTNVEVAGPEAVELRADVPIAVVTGSNGKTTVVGLTAAMSSAARVMAWPPCPGW